MSLESFDGSEMDDCDFVLGSVLLLGVFLLSSRCFSLLVALVFTVLLLGVFLLSSRCFSLHVLVALVLTVE